MSIDKNYYVTKNGEINSPKGMDVKLFTLDNQLIGQTNIVRHNNTPSQKLMKKLGYKILTSSDIRNLLHFEL